ncbi:MULTISPECIES: NUDIX domain-containing protein [Arthrobacter]|uniref:Oxidized purine nucleoside triphosphate hydrolase n=2 Tax=Arthrobacter TaxID=1663 RepID=A0ABU9KNW0_9MICC|nr:NUDIX domain-containing protein [Arthrobacter sp. YJM1]MDP5228500.1 NUDIX domain-containing protein [Arthrobacter sp. YJM1]
MDSAASVALCFLVRPVDGRSVRDGADGWEALLGLKKTGFARGKVVGIGGHVEDGETVAQAVVREVREEVGAVVPQTELHHLGTIRFRFPARPAWDMDTVLYAAGSWEGEISESAEIAPEWHGVNSLPYARMWPDAGYWVQPILMEALAAVREGTAGHLSTIEITLAEDNHNVASARYDRAAAGTEADRRPLDVEPGVTA